MFGFKTRRRNRLRTQPFPEAWLTVLRQNVPYYERLSVAEQAELRSLIQVVIAEKNFEGCGGLELTDEIKVTIAAYACILLLHRQHDFYPRLESVVVYPDVYPVPVTRQGPGNTVIETHEVRAGESWPTGTVVISWNHLRHRPTDPVGGHNVALHEFAHQLDQENGVADGAPELARSSQYRTWARVLGQEYKALLADAAAASGAGKQHLSWCEQSCTGCVSAKLHFSGVGVDRGRRGGRLAAFDGRIGLCGSAT